jgi:hypothetical protein
MPIPNINNGQSGLSVRNTLNDLIDAFNSADLALGDIFTDQAVQNGRLDALEANTINKNGDNNINGIFNCEPGLDTIWRGSYVDPANTFLNISTFALLDDGTGAMTFYSEDPNTFMTLAVGSVDFRNNRTRVYFGGMSYNSTIEARENSIKLIGNSPTFALEYDADYSSNFAGNHRAIPDIAYIQSVYQPQIDAIVSGLSWKNACRAATTTDITLSGLQTVDGVSLDIGDRCLVKNQTDPEDNGIYVVASGSWTRSTDFNTASQMPSSTVAISEGIVNQDKQFVCTNDLPITVGTTPINFVLVGGTTYVGTAGRITVTGNVIDVGSDIALKSYADAKVEDNLIDSTTVAPSKTAVNIALGSKLNIANVTVGWITATTLNASSTYYIGYYGPFGPATNPTNARRFRSPITGDYKNFGFCTQLTVASVGANTTIQLHNITQGTSVNITTTHNWSVNNFFYSGFSLAANEGDVMELRFATGAFSTAPANVQLFGNFTISSL